MKRKLALQVAIVALYMSSQSMMIASGSQQPSAQPGPTDDFVVSFPVPLPNETFYVQMPEADQTRISEALFIVRSVWAGDEFKKEITNHHFQPYRDDKVDGTSVYLNITAPHPKLLSLYMCSEDKPGDDASTAPATHQTCIFPGYLHDKKTDKYALSDTISHEFTHTAPAGAYRHPEVSNRWSRLIGIGKNRDNTVPYAVGCITENIGSGHPEKSMLPDPCSD